MLLRHWRNNKWPRWSLDKASAVRVERSMRYRTRSWQTIEVDLGSTGLGVLECLSPRPTFCPSGMVLSLQAIATRAQSLGSVKDIQSHLRHSRADTTANEYMQVLPRACSNGRNGPSRCSPEKTARRW